MKVYKNIQIGEVIPENAELYNPCTKRFEPYWTKECPFSNGVTNCIFDPATLIAPVL